MYVHFLGKISLSEISLLSLDYVPCTTPLNMTITLDNRPEIPLHPLDLTAEPPDDNRAQSCIGLIQTADSQLSTSDSSLGSIILGVPFLRNVYTVMAYTAPNADGFFTSLNGSNQTITPRLGLLSLTNSTIALEEFNTVRLLNQPISGGGSGNSSADGNGSSSTVSLGGKTLSVGIVVLIGILSFFTLCGLLFVIRWFVVRRKFREAESAEILRMDGDVYGADMSLPTTEVYMLSKSKTTLKDEKSTVDNDRLKFEEAALASGTRKEKTLSYSTMSSDRTKIAIVDNEEDGDNEFGGRMEQGRGRERDVERESLAAANGDVQHQQKVDTLYPVEEPEHSHSSLSPSSTDYIVPLPILSPSSTNYVVPFPSQTLKPLAPSHHQSTVLDPHALHEVSSQIHHHETENHESDAELDEVEFVNDDVKTSMAGIGTASRTSKFYLDSNFLRDVNMNNAGDSVDEDKGVSSAGVPPSDISTRV